MVEKLLAGPSECIGLDVGSTSIKAALVGRKPNGFKLLQTVIEPLPPSADAALRAQTIRRTFQLLGKKDLPIVSAVGGQGTVVRTVQLPDMSAQELKAALAFEAEKYIPFKLEDAFFDSSILDKKLGGKMEVLLAAARKDLVSGHLEILSSADLVPSVLDLESLALANLWDITHPAASAGMVALLHIGARGTILNFFQGKQLQFTREIPFGGDQFTQALAERFQIEIPLAEKLKCQPSQRLEEVREALQSCCEEWFSQCRVSLDFFENQFGQKVDRLALSGGSSHLIDLKDRLQETMGVPVEDWNPLSGFSLEGSLQQNLPNGPVLAVAIGLALHEAAR